jgi:PhnB protein
MIAIQPELWVDLGATAIEFYRAAFGAQVAHRVGDGEDVVAQLTVGDAAFWVAATTPGGERLVPSAAGGATGRILLVVDDPDAMHARAVSAGATIRSPVTDEHGWRIGSVVDPFGHEWEIGIPTMPWPPR